MFETQVGVILIIIIYDIICRKKGQEKHLHFVQYVGLTSF